MKEFCCLLELTDNFVDHSTLHQLTAHLFAAAHMILKLSQHIEGEQGLLMIPLIHRVLRKYPESVEHSRVAIHGHWSTSY